MQSGEDARIETLIGLVAHSAAAHDRRPALLIRPGFRTRTWRYCDLGEVVPCAARVLSEAGVRRGDRVILWSVNRPEWGIALLAIAHAGAVSVPLDVRNTPEFARKIADQTEARLVVASRQTEKAARELGPPILMVESLPDRARRAEPLSAAAISPDDLAEIVFTSGTTGDPKGAMLSHRNLLACATAMTQIVSFGSSDRLVSILPLSHLYEQVLGFIAPLIVGGSIVYPVSRQPIVLLRTVRDFRASMLLIVPQGLRLINSTIERRVDQAGYRRVFELLHAIARRLPRHARRVLFRPVLGQIGGRLHTVGLGASAMDVALGERWMEMGVDILQGYGATEMGPVVTFTRPHRNRLHTVGEPIPGVEMRIADDGEVLARGPNRFLGYWGNAEATAAAIDADGWYHTGDLGELTSDGMLVFRGRKKDMLALPDGQKVYPEDVEAILHLDSRVSDAAVVGWPEGPDLRVHAVLLLKDPADAADVVRMANEQLASHQRIRGLTIWPDDDLPRTHTLKVRKPLVLARLRELEAAGGSPADAAAAERSSGAAPIPATDPLIAVIASIAGLSADRVTPGVRLSSDLELDSLQRVELLGAIEEELGVYLDDDAVDPDATVAEVGAMVDAARGAKRKPMSWRWPLNPIVRAFGVSFQTLLMHPFASLFYRIETRGFEVFEGLDGPVLITPNHCLHLDNAIILSRLPLRIRWKLSVAAGAETIYASPVRGVLASILANAFPLAREGAVRRSLELLGARLDRGFNVLLYPEGKLTVGGPMQPFMAGAGLIAVEGGLQVVPVRLRINRMSVIDRRRLPSALRGDVELIAGAPLRFDVDTDPLEATRQLEEAVARL